VRRNGERVSYVAGRGIIYTEICSSQLVALSDKPITQTLSVGIRDGRSTDSGYCGGYSVGQYILPPIKPQLSPDSSQGEQRLNFAAWVGERQLVLASARMQKLIGGIS
jgi:hypothetical protein